MPAKKQNDSGNKGPQMSKDEMIGYHKGALNTLMNERNELIKMVQIVDQFIQGHVKALGELGVKLQTEVKK